MNLKKEDQVRFQLQNREEDGLDQQGGPTAGGMKGYLSSHGSENRYFVSANVKIPSTIAPALLSILSATNWEQS